MPFLLYIRVLQGSNTQDQLTKKNKLDVIVQNENTAITYQKCSSASSIPAGAEGAESRAGIAAEPGSGGAAGPVLTPGYCTVPWGTRGSRAGLGRASNGAKSYLELSSRKI